ncbi:hypothetical protein Syun_025019 [Stephania yunnanensis]|uniref:Mannosyltransferase n=1 Tax=Stephania yunnanensis TaxID=152371 RepID=A0AAP0EZP3_9MAGN
MMRRRPNSVIANTEYVEGDPDLSGDNEGRLGLKSSRFDLFSSSRRVFALCLMFRMVNSLLVQTYFNPDEHWQALEVAHRIVFGYGQLTWEWSKGIRSYLHPMVFVLMYKFMAFFHLDTPYFMLKAPRLLQSIFSSIGDLYLYKLSHRVFGKRVAQWTIFAQLTNWFMFFCFTRTLSNCLETVLTLMGLYYFPSFRESSKPSCVTSRTLGLALAALACAIRPTSAITWLYIGLLELLETHDRMAFVFLEVAPTGFVVLALTHLLDWWMYGYQTLVPLNFLKFNFLSSGGDYYGTHKWHWYLTQGFPVMLFTFLPFCIVGIFQSKRWKLFGLMAWVIGLYSLLGHKEFRFVLPVLPIALMFSGYSLATLEAGVGSNNKRKIPSKNDNNRTSKVWLAILFLLSTNLPMALYMSLVHQRGSEDVMYFLSKEERDDKVRSVLFLTPCHATPYYSALHRNLPMRFLDCSPSDTGILDESDRFMLDPTGFISDLVKDWSIPSHIVLFDSQERQLKEFLNQHSFVEVKRFFHAHFKVDRDLQASIVVYALAL